MATLSFLGTASALPTAERTNTVLAFTSQASPGQGLLVDCGGCVYTRLMQAGIGPNELSDLFITHAHIDHIGSLPSLLESWRIAGRTTPLRIWGLSEVLDVARRLVAVFDFELTLDHWSFPVSFSAVESGSRVRLGAFEARVLRMDHAVPSAGLRLELPKGPVAYTCDTQPASAVIELARGARMLITECTFLQANRDFARHTKHSTAFEAGQEAAQSGVELLALVHLGEGDGWSIESARAEASKSFAGTILIPQDLQTFDV
jgi:ribonuclease BN (tRNA processing enzyme)